MMQGKIVLVTGATNGIGREAAIALAQQGAQVIVHGRSAAKVAEVVGTITAAGGQARGMLADLTKLDDIRKLAAEFKQHYTRLDVLLNNAGGVFNESSLTPDGFETTFAVNHLSYFLLTHLLLDVLKASAPARIVNVSSDAHRAGRINFDSLGKGSGGFGAYANSKLMNVLFTFELARRLAGTGVTANALHPGFVATGFGQNMGGIASVIFGKLLRPFARKADDGAATSLYLATSPAVEGVTGAYFSDSKATRAAAAAYDEQTQRRLWEASAVMTGVSAS